MICWVDLETTGLMRPDHGCIMEVACVMTTDHLHEISRINVVHHESLRFESVWSRIDPFVCNMHATNGLYKEVFDTLPSPSPQLDMVLTAWWEEWEDMHDLSEVPMAGNTIHFDRAWLKQWCPVFEAKFNYRNFDMSTMNQAVRRWAPELLPEETMSGEEGTQTHRAMDDVLKAIELAAEYRSLFRKMGARIRTF